MTQPNICDFSFSLLSENINQYLAESQHENSPKEHTRFLWMRFVLQYKKYVEMQEVVEFLKISNLLKKLRTLRLHIYFNRYYRLTMKKRWCRFQTRLLQKQIHEKFEDRGNKMREVRARQVAKYLTTHSTIFAPDFSFLVPANQNANPVHNLQGDKEIPKEDTTPRWKRPDAIKFYILVIFAAILLGIVFYRVKNSSLYRYLRGLKPKEMVPIQEKSIFDQAKSPSQEEVIDYVLKIV
ncbi:hypothetical protein TRFO_09847 [Tritrichomonas foetus]|uniref:Uncharacterized protein n=1 Tax=Tritrichomonas foetus TaxID=1144522 RepID=A0A1J4JHE0_9EUKA|nr:hypothetical protein TRFO_09847 [Tritrichomonas foetus]|eukprot:OHS96684.1 hypothetical protein TRFO_09847 [Tritrichomonas foetus]